jgi:hypothetical protein
MCLEVDVKARLLRICSSTAVLVVLAIVLEAGKKVPK